MEYLLKSSCLLIIFYLSYRIFLNRDTLFNPHRWFLLFGLIASLLIPLIVIPNYVEYQPIELVSIDASENVSELSPALQTSYFDWFSIIQGLYYCGVAIMLFRFVVGLFSIFKLFNSHRIQRKDGMLHIKTKSNISPFSFFNLVVYNPDQYKPSDLQIILAHEEVHIRDWHTLDVILCELMTIIFWFNPFCHLYKKHLKQNLEFIADSKANNRISQDKTYETVLLKTSLSNYSILLGNRFYNSLIKKRIVMLQKPKSNKLNLLKYLIILPLIGAFMMGFNTKTIYVASPTKIQEQAPIKQDLNVLKYVITQKTSDEQLNKIKDQFKAKDVDIKFSDIYRDNNGYITGIHIDFKSTKSNGNYHIAEDGPISDILIKYDVESGSLSVGNNTDNMSQTIHLGEKRVKIHTDTIEDVKIRVIEKIDDDSQEEGKSKTKSMSYSISKGDNVFVIADDDDHYVVVDTLIKEKIKKLNWVSEDGSKTNINANNNKNNVFFYKNYSDKPLIIKDGKILNQEQMKKIDPNGIKSINVWKGDKAIKRYGKAGKNGVIYIESDPKIAKGYSFSIKNKNENENEFDFDFSEDKSNMTAIGYNKDYKYAFAHLDKTSTKQELEKNKEALKKLGVNVTYSKIRRNRENEITRIKILLEDENGKEMNVSYNNSDGIPEIRYGKNHDGLFANSSK